VIYPPKYVGRMLLWGLLGRGAKINDYKKFPYRETKNAPPAFHFRKNTKEDLVSSIFCKLCETQDLDKFLKSTGTTAFIVIQDDEILYEKYFNGYGRDSVQTSFSCAKSFASALVGIAVDEGYIGSVEDPITKYIPELKERDTRFDYITIKHLLMMSSGIKYAEFPFLNGDDAKTYYYPDLRKLALEKTKIVRKPFQHFLYNNFHPLLIGIVLERATGTPVANYLEEKIWKPLGMEYEGSWSIDSKKSGFEKMESGINASTIDFAKFGRLFLNGGNWEGNQIISENWVKESTQRDNSIIYDEFYLDKIHSDKLHMPFFESRKGYYKYFWWGYTRDKKNYDFFAGGNHGQFIYVCPQKKLIIIRNGKKYGIDGFRWTENFYNFASEM
jgi:CubicO group peptidase (beta-lactamase class C family)